MKIKKRLSDNPMPRYWSGICKEAMHIWDVRFNGCSISTKVIIFADSKDASLFMQRQFSYKWNDDCKGLFFDLSQECYKWVNGKEKHYRIVDPKYIGVMCLLLSDLRMEIIAHECCHAAIAYAYRINKKWPDINQNPDEAICYPLGKLVAQVCSAIQQEGYAIVGNHGTSH